MKQLLSAMILLGSIFLSIAIEHNTKLANGETLQNTNIKMGVSTEENLSGTLQMVKDRSYKRIQKQKSSKEHETPRLKSKWTSRKSLTRCGRRLISKNEFETGSHDSGSVTYFSGEVPFTSDYHEPMHHPPKNN